MWHKFTLAVCIVHRGKISRGLLFISVTGRKSAENHYHFMKMLKILLLFCITTQQSCASR